MSDRPKAKEQHTACTQQNCMEASIALQLILFLPYTSPPPSTQLSLSDILKPAIDLAEGGFPVAPVTAFHWQSGSADLAAPGNAHGRDVLLRGEAPQAGEVMRMPLLGKTFRV